MNTGNDKQFMYNITKRKENPEGFQLLCLLSPCLSIDSSPVWYFAAGICLINVWKELSVTLQILIQMHRQSCFISKLEKMMKVDSLQGYDEVPRRLLGALVFLGALSKMCLMFLHLFKLLFESVHISWSNDRFIVSCDNWPGDNAEMRKKGVNVTKISLLSCCFVFYRTEQLRKLREVNYVGVTAYMEMLTLNLEVFLCILPTNC